ncbi:MAG: phospholipase D-like domain-containing protein [Steroidobacteraceae bacterium]
MPDADLPPDSPARLEQPPAPPGAVRRFVRAAKLLLFALLLAWLWLIFWNSAKPLPPGIHVVSETARLSEADVDFLYPAQSRPASGGQDLAAIDRAEQLIVLDRSPVTPDLAQHLLARKRQRPNLKVVVVTDPAAEAFGGTPLHTLAALEESGIIVARVRLDRLRDSNPLYSGLWRLALDWWSDPFDEAPGGLPALLRRLNFKADQRQLMVADDGAGGWIASVGTGGGVAAGSGAVAGGKPGASAALMLRGSLARAITGSELQIAAWSTGDDRLPPSPQSDGRGVGSIDARFLTEGAIEGALFDAISAAETGDQICIAVDNLSDRRLIGAMLRAAARGARLQVLLALNGMPNQPVAAELMDNGAGRIEVRWYPAASAAPRARLLLVRHRADLWLNLGSADFTRRNLGDLNLEAAVELRMPARAVPARAAAEHFAQIWSSASTEPSPGSLEQGALLAYWRYRLAEAVGLSDF